MIVYCVSCSKVLIARMVIHGDIQIVNPYKGNVIFEKIWCVFPLISNLNTNVTCI